jgi:Hemerythrin HHE cation binding domain
MKRAPALTSLSREHHRALFTAHVLRRATADRTADVRRAFLDFWNGHGRLHFRLEEEILLPAFAGHGDPHHVLVARTLCDHVDLRRRASALDGDEHPSLVELHELGFRLAAHIRLEERKLFPLIEQAMPPAALSALANELAVREAGEAAADG